MSKIAASGSCGSVRYVITSEDNDTVKAEVVAQGKKEEKVLSSWKQAEAWVGDFLKTENYMMQIDETDGYI